MANLPFYIVDVFAERKYAGNQLAVVLNAGSLSDGEMQAIAKEMNYSETSFVLSTQPDQNGYPVRIYTPQEEVPFAGHPTLGTAFVIREIIGLETLDSLTLSLKVGPIPVSFSPKTKEDTGLLWMNQNQPVFGRTFSPQMISSVLNLSMGDLDLRYPIEEVSTGLPFILAPLKSLDAVKKSRVEQRVLLDLVKDCDAKAILVFAPQTYDPNNQLNVRVFVDCFGIPEDPATGSANGCLAGYLVKHSYFGDNSIKIRVEQGTEIGRPSLLHLKANEEFERIKVMVGGKVIMVAKGELV